MQQISTAPKADGWRLPSAAHEPGRGANSNAVSPPMPAEPPPPTARPDREAEPYKADRALNALAARFTGGISPIALSLAYIDWAWHLAAAPQRQMEISATPGAAAGSCSSRPRTGLGPFRAPGR
jgi:polyhydroxyalkanoate synthase